MKGAEVLKKMQDGYELIARRVHITLSNYDMQYFLSKGSDKTIIRSNVVGSLLRKKDIYLHAEDYSRRDFKLTVIGK